MLEGLEISVIQKSEAFDQFFNARIDPEFFQKYYTRLYKKILSKKYELLGDIAFITDGEHGNAVTTEVGHSKYYGARNVLTGILSDNDVEYISEEHHNKLRKSALIPRDVLISCVGANVGFAAIVPDDIGIANIVRNVALIRSHAGNFLNEYLQAYLSSSYGKNLYIRMNTGNAQPLVSLDYIKTVPVFKPTLELQKRIRDLTDLSLEALKKSKNLYSNAEQVLLEAVGLADFKPSTQNTNIKTIAQSFGSSGRLDAEYYQPKYEAFESTVKSNKYGYTFIKNEYDHFNDVSRKLKSAYHYIEISDVNVSDGTNSPILIETTELPANAKFEVKKGDLIISKVRPNRGAITVIEEEFDNLIVSGAFTVLREKPSSVFTKEVLKVLLRTPVYREWMLQFNVGTQYPVIRDEDILNLPIPKIDLTTQTNISQLVQQSFSLKAQSEHLLNVAKRAVEMAIEQDEAAAMAFITKSL